MSERVTAQPEDPDAVGHPADHKGQHEAPEGAPLDPLIDLSRDPTPGKPNHARPDDD